MVGRVVVGGMFDYGLLIGAWLASLEVLFWVWFACCVGWGFGWWLRSCVIIYYLSFLRMGYYFECFLIACGFVRFGWCFTVVTIGC